MKKSKRLIAGIGLMLCLSLTGCGSSGSNSYSNIDSVSQSGSGNYYADSYYPSANEEVKADSGSEVEKEFGDKLVYTCNITIETLGYDDSLKSIRDSVATYGGVISSESETDNDYNWYYDDYNSRNSTRRIVVEARIPSGKYHEFLSSLEGTGKVRDKYSNVENISRTYYDTAAVIESLEIQQERLLAMMDDAKTIEEMIQVESRLTEVQTQLNRNKTALAVMQTDVDYSTVTITLEEVLKYEKVTNTFFDRLKNTFEQAFDDFKEILEGLIFFIILLIPRLIIFVPVICLIVFVVKKYMEWKKRRKDFKNVHKMVVKDNSDDNNDEE